MTEGHEFLATVANLYDDGISLLLDGQIDETEKHYKVNASASYAPGQRVKCVRISGTILVEYPIDNTGGGEIAELQSIEITTPPTKTAYLDGEVFNTAGMVVMAHYADGRSVKIRSYTYQPVVMVSGTTAVTVSYTSGGTTKTTTQAVAVAARLVEISVTHQPTKVSYEVGETFASAGMVVTASYSDGNSKAVTGYSWSPQIMAVIGTQVITVSYTESGFTETATLTVSVHAPQGTVPEQRGTLTYNGTAQSPEWDYYDSAKMTMGGVTVGTNAGVYVAEFTINEGYTWPDGTTGKKQVSWTISKAPGQVTISPQTLTLSSSQPSGQITVTRLGTGQIHAASSDEAIATAVRDENTVTVTGTGASGSVTVTITVDADENYAAPQAATCAVTAAFNHIWGVVWNYNNTSTELTRLTPATDPNGYVTETVETEPVPAVGTGSGSSPFDSVLPWSGMVEYNIQNNAVSYKKGQSGFSRTKYDTVVFIPEFCILQKDDSRNKKRYYYLSDVAKTGFTKHPGGGKYVARYEASTGPASKSGLWQENGTRSAARTNAKNKGSHWSLNDLATWCAIQWLYLIEFADWDSQAKIGKGRSDTGYSGKTGLTDSMRYHTGRQSGTDGQTSVQYRWIENPWGNFREFIDGVNVRYGGVYYCTDRSKYADGTTGYTSAGYSIPSNWGTITTLRFVSAAPWAILPEKYDGTGRIPDQLSASSSSGTIRYNVSGSEGNYSDAGLFYASFSTDSDTARESFRILFNP